MSYLVIARKYRPSTFEEVIGQDHVTKTLTNAIKLNKVHHAYIFTGPRGVGKTSISRILAKALNCETGITAKPCGICKNCQEIESGFSIDVREIDGASNRSIDDIRELRDGIKFSPASCRKKIYILDEVHMLTTQAFNALLKTLEEPPEHALFIFATTEINEVPATILSRCQRFDFKRVPIDILSDSLKEICDKENIEIDEESLLMIARAGDGSVRDSQSVLDRVIAFCGTKINSDNAAEALGLPQYLSYHQLFNICLKQSSSELFKYVDNIVSEGVHFNSYLNGLMEFVRNLMIYQSTGSTDSLYLSKSNTDILQKLLGVYKDNDLMVFLDLISKGILTLKSSMNARIDFELVLMKILFYEPVNLLSEILSKLENIDSDVEISSEMFKQLNFGDAIPKNDEKIVPIDEKSLSNENTQDLSKIEQIAVDTNNDAIEDEMISEPDHYSESIDDMVVNESDSFDDIENVLENDNIEEDNNDQSDTEDLMALSIDEIRSRWKEMSEFIFTQIPMLTEVWKKAVPISYTEKTIKVMFDNSDKTLKNLTLTKLDELISFVEKFYGVEGLKIQIVSGVVNDSDRIFEIEKNKEVLEVELKEKFLEKTKLEFLFSDPYNCKILVKK
ncbi:MAG: DNA polymerase III subunit gamma/tau [Candidatus Delongbacteria bacterium]|nr:DNA polymerase III subunit gamma/tau [Candidatus Delongbacteria bacterium]MBN2835152.1 DNA polymerase III subunit gamma/tau [Candidatus Delongbacteria bacterium]